VTCRCVFRPGTTFRLVAARANGQPAFGIYVRDPRAMAAPANGVMVFALAGGQIGAMTRFDTSVLPLFRLPPTLPG
jgi:RNA polymerase sigma-70 factor, ECF subfamily